MTKEKYFIGTFEDAPFHNVAVAGVSFPQYSDPAIKDGTGAQHRNRTPGAVIELDEDKVAEIKKKAFQRVFRTVGQRSKKGRAYDKTLGDKAQTPNPRFLPQETDRVAAEFIYMAPVDDVKFGPSGGTKLPESLFNMMKNERVPTVITPKANIHRKGV